MTNFKLAVLALLPISLLLAGCCNRVDCPPCLPLGVNLVYVDGQNLEIERALLFQLEVREFKQADSTEYLADRLFEEPQEYYDGFIFPLDQYRYWTVTNDSLGVNDTIRVGLAITERKRGGCCNCGEEIQSVSWGINGETYRTAEVRRPL